MKSAYRDHLCQTLSSVCFVYRKYEYFKKGSVINANLRPSIRFKVSLVVHDKNEK